MGLFVKRDETKQSKKRVVVTGKRVKGVWTMESALAAKPQRAKGAKGAKSILATDNRRIRTLH